MADEKVVVIGRTIALVLAEGDEVAVVQLQIGTSQDNAVLEREDVVHLNRLATVGFGFAAGAVGFLAKMGLLP
jgi:hypothetical protein